MSELIEINAKSLSPKAFSIDVESIKKTVEAYSLMTIDGIDDKKGMKAVRESRLELRRIRVGIEKRGKELRADSTAFSKRVIEIERELTALVEPTEEMLAAREEAVAKEIAAIATAKLDARLASLAAVECDYPRGAVESMSDAMFDSFLEEKKEKHHQNLEAARIVAEEAERKRLEEVAAKAAEEARMKAEREELDRERAALAEAKRVQDEAAAEARRLEEERNAKERAAFREQEIEQARKIKEQQDAIDAEIERLAVIARKAEADAYEQRRQQELERARQEAVETERKRAEAEIIEQARQADARVSERLRVEALKPDREKLIVVADNIERMSFAHVSDSELRQRAECVLIEAGNTLRLIAASK